MKLLSDERPSVMEGHTILSERVLHNRLLAREELLACACKTATHGSHGPYWYLYKKTATGSWDTIFGGKKLPTLPSPRRVRKVINRLLSKERLSDKEFILLESYSHHAAFYEETDELGKNAQRVITRECEKRDREIHCRWDELDKKANREKLTEQEAKEYKLLCIMVSIDH